MNLASANKSKWQFNRKGGGCLLFSQLCSLNGLFKCFIFTFLLLQDSRTPTPFIYSICKHLKKPHLCTTLLTLLHLSPLQARTPKVWPWYYAKQAHECVTIIPELFLFWVSDLVELALAVKLLLCSSHSCAHLPWSGQWIFRMPQGHEMAPSFVPWSTKQWLHH